MAARRQRCRYRPACHQLRRLLGRGGVAKEAIFSCPPTTPQQCPCDSFVGNAKNLYFSLPGEHSHEVLAFLRTVLGRREPLVQSEFSPGRKKDFFCPELRITMHQPCRLKSCPFKTPNSWLGNCILNYLTKQEKAGLNYNELTFLLNESAGSLRSKVNAGVKKLRVGALRDLIQKNHETGLFRRINGVGSTCVVCELPLLPGEGLVKNKRRYCGQACFAFKPPAVIGLEDEYSISIERLLQICNSNFSTSDRIAPLLHLPQSSIPKFYDHFGLVPPPPPV